MESGYFLETTSPWRCLDADGAVGGPSGSLPLLLNMSALRCNRSSARPTNETDAEESLPQFNQLSLVKTVVLSAMFVVALTGNVAKILGHVCRGTDRKCGHDFGHIRCGDNRKCSQDSRPCLLWR